jgi:retron-type reverse transcriptase
MENLLEADIKASKGKSNQHGVKVHNSNRENNLIELQSLLLTKTFTTSAYTTFKIFEPKEREISRLPYYPDRIVHHAILNILEPIFVSVFTADTYSCIKGRGIHSGAKAIKKALKDKVNTRYCLKLDIKKFL